MKRIVILCMICVMLMSAVANAEISKGKDNFTNQFFVSSYVNMNKHFNTVYFIKYATKNNFSFRLSLILSQMKEYVLNDTPIEIKVDDEPAQELSDYRYKLIGPDSYGVNYNSSIEIQFPVELAEKIKYANKVIIRYENAKGLRMICLLPQEVLNEWKQVINTEK